MLIRHLAYFVTLAREKHYARAADACNIAQPTLSAAIRKLEEDLQVHLVIRGHRFIGLTPDGEKVLQWGQRILVDYASLREGLSGSHVGLTGVLRLGVIPAAMPAVALLTAHFAAAHPVVSIEIQSMTSRAIQHGLDAFEIDGGLTYLDNEPLENVRQVPLYRERYVFITKRGNLYADRQTVSWAEAVQVRLCLLSEGMQNRRIIDKLATAAGVQIGANVVTDSFVGVYSHLIRGEWSSIVPHVFSQVFGRATGLVTVELTDPGASQSIGLVLPSREPLSPIAGALMAIASKADLEEELAMGGAG
jgi:DNA-binding transcriptional LysR family regulator